MLLSASLSSPHQPPLEQWFEQPVFGEQAVMHHDGLYAYIYIFCSSCNVEMKAAITCITTQWTSGSVGGSLSIERQ